ncbi:DUF4123 domain-containing protein [Stenotrophomonas rhizophila]|uniref:DUF4123 domain-containing protein n=1 Tax=Stenotrophomonas rhizophila TaxID=216778 RepID=UPI002A6A1E78|nr:DUF4123 domain-containing protein [Stenotrophomonas rhizophila]MDY0955830.1 DUF4123 domain-containing protein [Stenotrophomonas rhizophila]
MSRYDARYDVYVELRERMRSSVNAWFVLVDPMSRCALGSLETAHRKKHIVDLDRFGIDRELCPFILELDGPSDVLLEETLTLAWERRGDWQQPQPICGWISSALPAAAVAGAVLRQAVVATGDGKRRLERFYDPRVARHAGFSESARHPFEGADVWAQLGWDGELQAIPCMTGTYVAPASPVQPDPRAAWCVAVNAAISQLQRMDDLTLEREQQLQAAVDCAMHLGLCADEAADATTFLLHKVLVHPQIERHPVIAEWLREAVAGAGAYADRCAEADAEWWQAIEHGAWSRNTNGFNVEARHG